MGVYAPVEFVRTATGSATMPILWLPEGASKTHLVGAPLVLNAGYTEESADAIVGTVIGFAASKGQNLTAAGTAEDGYSEGHPQNQPSGVIIPAGAWVRPGKTMVMAKVASLVDPIFSAHLILGQVFTDAMVGTRYELNKDGTTGFWIIDNTDSGVAAEHVCKVVGVDPRSPNSATLGARVFFTLF